MKSKMTPTRVAIISVIVSIISTAAPAYADGSCSLAHAAGNYSFTDMGTVIGVGSRTAVGTFTLDRLGKLTNGIATSSLNGSVADETFFGTYMVNPNCTGTISVRIFASGTEILEVTLDIAFDDDMKQIRGIFTSVAEPDGTPLSTVISLEGRRQ